MGHIDLSGAGFQLPDGRTLLDDVSFRVGEGMKAVLVGANGSGKTTLLRVIAGDVAPGWGSVNRSGGLGVMRQFIGAHGATSADGVTAPLGAGSTVRDLLISVAPPRLRVAALEHDAAELAMMERDDTSTQMRYAQALSDWADAGGYETEVVWDTCTMAALGIPFARAQYRELGTLSGGEQKRLALEALLRGPDEVLLLDEPDNYLDVPGKRWLEGQLRETPKTVLFVRLLADPDSVPHTGHVRLGARVVPGHFAQTHHHPEWSGRTLAGILADDHALPLEESAPALHRYELVHQRDRG